MYDLPSFTPFQILNYFVQCVLPLLFNLTSKSSAVINRGYLGATPFYFVLKIISLSSAKAVT